MATTVTLHIKDHCIETEAKNELKRLMDRYFSEDDVEGLLEEQIDLVREFVESSDFPALRASDPRLSGEVQSIVLIQRNKKGKPSFQFQ